MDVCIFSLIDGDDNYVCCTGVAVDAIDGLPICAKCKATYPLMRRVVVEVD